MSVERERETEREGGRETQDVLSIISLADTDGPTPRTPTFSHTHTYKLNLFLALFHYLTLTYLRTVSLSSTVSLSRT